MSNFIEEFNKGQRGEAKGIPFGEGLESITMDTSGIHKARIYGVGGPEKSGKSTFTDYAFVIQPYLYCLANNIPIDWEYYSFEIDRVSKEFDFITYFLHKDYGVLNIKLPNGITHKGSNILQLNPEYLRGHLLDDKHNLIKVHEDLKPLIRKTYENRIIPLFGEYASNGIKIRKGVINFKEGRDNPTGVYKDLIAVANREGTITKGGDGMYLSYQPDNPKKIKIVIVDHIRKLHLERGWQLKQTIDKMSEYMVMLRNLLGYTFVPILHTNRNLGSVERLGHFKSGIYPTSSDLKDSGNLGEDCNYLFMTFNPNDDQYALKKHFDMDIRDSKGNILFPNLRSIHLVSSRHGEFPRHYKTNMFGNIKKFEKI